MISYEEFDKNGLVRYFIFKKSVDVKEVSAMFHNLVSNAKNNKIDFIYTILENNTVKELFLDLGFEVIDDDYFVIDEDIVTASKYKNAFVMKYNIN